MVENTESPPLLPTAIPIPPAPPEPTVTAYDVAATAKPLSVIIPPAPPPPPAPSPTPDPAPPPPPPTTSTFAVLAPALEQSNVPDVVIEWMVYPPLCVIVPPAQSPGVPKCDAD